MDFIVVAKPGASFCPPRMGDFTKQQRFIMSHRAFILSDSVHARHRAIDPWILHAMPIVGDEQKYGIDALDTLNPMEHTWASFRRMLQWSNGFLRFIARTRCTDVCSARSFMDHCIGIKYFYRELAKMGLAGEHDDDENVNFFVLLRNEWFSRSDEENKQMMKEGVERFADSLRRFLGILSKHFNETVSSVPLNGNCQPKTAAQRPLLKQSPRSVIVDTPAVTYVYSENCTEVSLRYDVYRSLCPPIDPKGMHRFVCRLPLSLCCVCSNYRAGEGPLANQFRSVCCTDLPAIPMADTRFMKDFVAMTNRSLDETRSILLKGLFETYGYAQRATGWKARVFDVYKYFYRGLISSPMGILLRKRTYEGAL
jgi:hypothetical protein